jgi:hypothetical protein
MNLRAYYQRIREVAAELEPEGESVWLTSLATPDGGRAGVCVEAPRELAAKLIVEGRSRRAAADEVAKEQQRAAQMNRAVSGAGRVCVELSAVRQAETAEPGRVRAEPGRTGKRDR